MENQTFIGLDTSAILSIFHAMEDHGIDRKMGSLVGMDDSHAFIQRVQSHADKGTLIIPSVVWHEYDANRLRMDTEALVGTDKWIDDVKDILTPPTPKHYRYNQSWRSRWMMRSAARHLKRVEAYRRSIGRVVSTTVRSLEHPIKEWERIAIQQPLSSDDEVRELTDEAKHRYENKIPPGYCDTPKGMDARWPLDLDISLPYRRVYGDFYIWAELLRTVRLIQPYALTFVTRDTKEDWWEKPEKSSPSTEWKARKELAVDVQEHCARCRFRLVTPQEFISMDQASS